MISTTCTVTRRGQEKTEIPMDELVVGDIVHLSAGDMIPADVRILEAKDLFVSQASLTGESEPIEKLPQINQQKESITDYTNIAFMGSSVVSGSALAVAVCVGDDTLFGSMASSVAGEATETNFIIPSALWPVNDPSASAGENSEPENGGTLMEWRNLKDN